MTQAETIDKIVEDTAERIMRAIEDEQCIHKSSLVREISFAISGLILDPPKPAVVTVTVDARDADKRLVETIMQRIKRDLADGKSYIIGERGPETIIPRR